MKFGMIARVVSVMALISLTACTVKVDSPNVKINGEVKPVSCSVEVPSVAVDSGIDVPIKVKATGGKSPYKISGTSGNFGAEKTIARQYTNATNANLVVDDSVTVVDDLGLSSACDFSVTVKPAGTGPNPSTLACTMELSPANPLINQLVKVTVNVTGGDQPYGYNSLTSGTGSVVLLDIYSATATSGEAYLYYTSTGNRTVSAKVRDDNGGEVACSKPVSVRSGNVSLSALVEPTTSINVGESFTITAVAQNFATTPLYNFTTTETGITIVKNGNIATVTASNGLAHASFVVKVTATDGIDSVTTDVGPLTFTAVPTFTCSISKSATNIDVNANVTLTALASNNEALEITSFSAPGSTLTSYTTNNRRIKYASTGTKNITMKARSVSNPSKVCNAGADLTTSVTVSQNTALSCSATSNKNPAYVNEWVLLGATVPTGSGSGGAYLYRVCSTYECFYTNSTTAMSTYSYFGAAGRYDLTLTVKDSAGHSASCAISQVIW